MEEAEHQRRLSAAGVRKMSSDLVLTEDTDSFIVGDRVYVGGTMPGRIAYIGTPKFAPGDWAGVVLDQAIGKNDGTVNGFHYFMTEPNHGTFSRLTRLSRVRLGSPPPEPEGAGERRHSLGGTGGGQSGSRRSSRTSPARHVPTVTRSSCSPARVVAAAAPGLRAGSPGQGALAGSGTLRCGDRVTLASASGRKQGVLRFLGRTEFADGHWAGVELEEPRGRNDGTVAGTRYFECRPNFGLFAPSHKVTRLGPARRGSHPSTGHGNAAAVPDEDGFY